MKINPKICLSFIALNSYTCVSQSESSIAIAAENALETHHNDAQVIPEENNRENFFQEENARESERPFLTVHSSQPAQTRSPATRFSTLSARSPSTRFSTLSTRSSSIRFSTVQTAVTAKSPSFNENALDIAQDIADFHAAKSPSTPSASSVSASEDFQRFVFSGIDPESRLPSSLNAFSFYGGLPDFIDRLMEIKGSEDLDWPNFFQMEIGLPADTSISRFTHMIRQLNFVDFKKKNILNDAVDRGDDAVIRELFWENNEEVRIDEVDRESILDGDSSSEENSSSQITLGFMLGLGLIAWL